MQINYLDLFSGVGGFTRGLLDAGFMFGWHGFSEIDKHAVKLYQGLYPDSVDMGDITLSNLAYRPDDSEYMFQSFRTQKDKKARRLTSNDRFTGFVRNWNSLPQIDLITFGFPCQDLSIAGNRKGLEGKRSGLFFEALQIIKAVRPDCFIFENVKGLFSSKGGRDFKTVLQSISDLGLYDCQWQLCDTNWFLPQDRERIYFVGLLRKQGKFGRKIFPFGEAEKVFDRIGGGKIKEKTQHNAQTLTARDYASWNGNFVITGTLRAHKDRCGFRPLKSGNCPTITGCARQDGNMQPCLMYEDDEIRRFTPLECFRLQFGMSNAADMIAKAHELKISDTQLYKMAGNAVSSPVVQCIAERLLQVEG
jgi:DNA (cytosine-5)-methyltransferase 1